MHKVHVFCDDALADHDGVELAQRIRSGALRAAEVVRAAIARARKIDPQLNAIALETFDRALESAAVAGTGPFAGVRSSWPTSSRQPSPFAA
jgi:amidase